MLNAGPQVAASFVSSGYENVAPGPVQGPANKVQELEWDKAEKGELQEKTEVDLEAGLSEEKKEEKEEEVEEAPYERPSMDIFKAIFADSESEEEEEEEEEEPKKKTEEAPVKKEQPPAVEEMDDDVYGPQVPVSSTIAKVTSVSLVASQPVANEEEWVERNKKEKKKKDKEKKKKKDKKKKDKKKKKRRHSDSRSDNSDDEVDDVKILKKIATLIVLPFTGSHFTTISLFFYAPQLFSLSIFRRFHQLPMLHDFCR